jgi:hypothetical protein
VNVVPPSAVEVTDASPPCRCAISRTMKRPRGFGDQLLEPLSRQHQLSLVAITIARKHGIEGLVMGVSSLHAEQEGEESASRRARSIEHGATRRRNATSRYRRG